MKKCLLIACLFLSVLHMAVQAQSGTDSSRNSISHPIRFLTFTASRNLNEVRLAFTTPSESINSYYQVESSLDGSNWKSIATINAQNNANPINSYTYSDVGVYSKIIYYRIRQVFVNNLSSFSPILVVKEKSEDEELKIGGANGNSIAIYFPEQMKTNVFFRLYTLNGQSLLTSMLVKPSGTILIPLHNMARGPVIVSVSDDKKVLYTRQVIFR